MATQPVEDEFSAAFANLSLPENNGEPGGDPEAVPAPEPEPEAPAPEPEPVPEAPVEPAPEPEPPAPEPPAPEPAPAPQPAAEDAEATLARLASLVNRQPPPEPAAPAPVAAVDEPQIYSDDEQKILSDYEKEWGDVSRAKTLKRRAEYRGLLTYAFEEIMKEFKPIKEMAESLATRTHYQDIQQTVGDYTDAEREAIISWVGKQPTYLQTAYNSVIEQGTANEVADLVSRYRTETGTIKPAISGKDTELSSEAKQAAAALAPVGSKRSVVTQPDDLSNFDAGWKKFADMV